MPLHPVSYAECRSQEGFNAALMAFIADSMAGICNILRQFKIFGDYWHLYQHGKVDSWKIFSQTIFPKVDRRLFSFQEKTEQYSL